MKVAVIGSRSLTVGDLQQYIPAEAMEIVSGGAQGVDQCARLFAQTKKIKLTEFLPDYRLFGKSAPLKRNVEIIIYSDLVIAFWDGKSKGTRHVIDNCKQYGVPVVVHMMKTGHSV